MPSKIRFFLILITSLLFSNAALTQNLSSLQEWIKIKSIFKNFKSEVNGTCNYQYKLGTEPDIDFMVPVESIASTIKKSQVIKLCKYYSDYCKKASLLKPESTLSSKKYSIELNYIVRDKQIVRIHALIFSKDEYLILEMGKTEY
jgi:hypothetical protein